MIANHCLTYKNSYTVKTSEQDPATILSIDGGGVRGIFPALLIEEIEKRTRRKSNELFKIIAGTSIGSLIGGGLAIGIPADKIVRLWESEAKNIFNRSLFREVTTINGYFAPRWSVDPLEKLLEDNFGDVLLKDTSTELICSAIETTKNDPWCFNRNAAANNPTLSSIKVREVIRSSAAAPGFFRSSPININGEQLNFVDGSLFAPNPSNVAYSFAGNPEHSLVLSLGTGRRIKPLTYHQTAQMGIIEWAVPAVEMMIQGNADETHDIMKRSLPENSYFRWQTTLDRDVSLDDADQIPYLIRTAKTYIAENDKSIDKTCDLLAAKSIRF